MISLEKIDYVMNTTKAPYDVVRRALLETNGDVDQAILFIQRERGALPQGEDNYRKGFEDGKSFSGKDENFSIGGMFDDLMQGIEDLWKKGNASELIIRRNGKTLLNLSLNVSAFGLVLAPVASLVGVFAAALSDCEFLVVLDNGKTIDVREYIEDKTQFTKKNS